MAGKWERLRAAIGRAIETEQGARGNDDHYDLGLQAGIGLATALMDLIEQSPDKPQAEYHDKVYRVSFELVVPVMVSRYTDPETRRQNVPSAQIPGHHWQQATRITTDPWDQFRTLARWAREESQHVRNVKLEVAGNLEDIEWAEAEDRPVKIGRLTL